MERFSFDAYKNRGSYNDTSIVFGFWLWRRIYAIGWGYANDTPVRPWPTFAKEPSTEHLLWTRCLCFLGFFITWTTRLTRKHSTEPVTNSQISSDHNGSLM